MKLEDIKAKLKEAGVDEAVITAVVGLDNSADVERLKGELEAEQGKAKGILEDKKRYKAERDTAKASLDKIETDKLPEAERHQKELTELKEQIQLEKTERETQNKELAKAKRESVIDGINASIKWDKDKIPASSARVIVATKMRDIDLSDEKNYAEALTEITESHKSLISASTAGGTGNKNGDNKGGSGGDNKPCTIGDSVGGAWEAK